MYNFAAYQKNKSKAVAVGYGTLEEFIAELKAKGLRSFVVYTRAGSTPVYDSKKSEK